MGRKTGFLRPGATGIWLLPAMAAVLCLWLGFLPGCNSQGGPARQTHQQFRPISNTARLMRNAAFYRSAGRVELAVDELELARLKEPENLEILDLLIQCYEGLGDFDRAQELYGEAAVKGAHQPAWENNRGFSLYLQGRLDQAETCFRKVLARQPDNQKARNNLGLVLCRQGREAEAQAMWREALNDAEARGRMGEAMAALGKEVPPSLAVHLPSPAVPARVAAAASPLTPPPAAAATRQASVLPASPPPVPKVVAEKPHMSPGSATVSPTGIVNKSPDIQLPAPDTLAARKAPAPLPSSPEPAETQAAASAPGQGPPRMAAAPVRGAGKLKQTPSAPPAAVAAPARPRPPVLTALELENTRIEVRNGNGIPHLARETRSSLAIEGYTIVDIGNHIDFGLEETVIAYRPGAARVARTLARQFFPDARIEESGSLSPFADVRISLGRDRLDNQNFARLHREHPTGLAPEPSPTGPAAPAPTARKTGPGAHKLTGATPAPRPDYLTAAELHQVRIELRNGNGVPGEAGEMGGRLALEGFTVVNIGNDKAFDLEKTVISYRPEAARVARVLSQKFFPRATLKEEGLFPPWTDVRVSLGRDLTEAPSLVAQAASGPVVP